MQREIEVKVLNIVPEEIEEKLISLGAEKICREMQTNYTFEPEDGEFKKGYLRIRESLVDDKRNPIELTFKEVKGDEDVRINNEFTVHIDSVSMMTSILDKMGVKLKYKGNKERISYRYKGQRFDIDTWDKNTYPHPYMEIEFTNQSKIDEILNDLGIEKGMVTTKSISDLISEL